MDLYGLESQELQGFMGIRFELGAAIETIDCRAPDTNEAG